MASELFKKLLAQVPLETEKEVQLSMQIALRIRELMSKKNLTQSELARKLGKDPSEINRWLSGMHIFTIKTLSKLHEALGEPIITIYGQSEPSMNQESIEKLASQIA